MSHLIEQFECIEWWHDARAEVRHRCHRARDEIVTLARQRIEALAETDIVLPGSPTLLDLEQEISAAIENVEKGFKDRSPVANPAILPGTLTDHAGFSALDLVRIAVGGSGSSAAALAASRLLPSGLAAIGLGGLAVAAWPIAAVAAGAGIAYSAYAASTGRRQDLLSRLEQAIHLALCDESSNATSLLSREWARLDRMRDDRLGDLK